MDKGKLCRKSLRWWLWRRRRWGGGAVTLGRNYVLLAVCLDDECEQIEHNCIGVKANEYAPVTMHMTLLKHIHYLLLCCAGLKDACWRF